MKNLNFDRLRKCLPRDEIYCSKNDKIKFLQFEKLFLYFATYAFYMKDKVLFEQKFSPKKQKNDLVILGPF